MATTYYLYYSHNFTNMAPMPGLEPGTHGYTPPLYQLSYKGLMVRLRGFEPRLTERKSAVLDL